MLKVLLFYLSCLPSTVTALIKNSGRNISFFVKSQIPQISVFSKINEWEMSFDLTFYTKTMSTPKSEKFWRTGEKEKKSTRTHTQHELKGFVIFSLVSGGQFFFVPLWLGWSTTGVYRSRRSAEETLERKEAITQNRTPEKRTKKKKVVKDIHISPADRIKRAGQFRSVSNRFNKELTIPFDNFQSTILKRARCYIIPLVT
jgi:hypothetical protein